MILRHFVWHMQPEHILPVVFLYVGPETILPLTSFLAALAGIVLMMWQRVLGSVRLLWQACFKKTPVSEQTSTSVAVDSTTSMHNGKP